MSAPLTRTISATVPGVGSATTDQDQTIDEVPFNGTVASAKIIPEANLTANGTNYRTWQIVNKGQDGNGTTVVATFASDTPTTDDLADFDEHMLTLSAVAGATTVTQGDVLAVVETHTGSGVAHSGYRVEVEISRG